MLELPDILLSVTALINAGLVFFIYSRNRQSRVNKSFALFVLFLSFWSIVILEFRVSPSDIISLYFIKLSYISALLIGACFYYFSLVFPENKTSFKLQELLVFGSTFVLAVLLLFPNFLTKNINHYSWGKGVDLNIQEYLLFSGLFLFLFVGGQIRLWWKFFKSKESAERFQLLYIAGSVSVIGLIGMYYNLLLPSPFYENFKYIWTGPIFTSFFAVVITYSIFRYKLFSTKAVLAELLVFSLWLFIFIRTLVSENVSDQLINSALLSVTVVLGIFLIRSVNQEIRAREQIEKLALDLEQANEKLKEFDRLKSEFLSMGTHQLRSPLTAIKGYASLITDGSFGKVHKAIGEAVDRIYQSSRSMANTIEDFLTISRIEQNRMKYDYAVTDMGKLVKDVIAELLPTAIKAGLQLTYIDDKKTPYNANIDLGKIRQVIINLLDNAMKYTPKGSITIRVGRDGATKKILVSFVDTGIGMTQATIDKLFQRFSRASDANKVNVMGTGLGLFVAKEMVTAHKGRIWAESEGPNKGSQFYVELDAV